MSRVVNGEPHVSPEVRDRMLRASPRPGLPPQHRGTRPVPRPLPAHRRGIAGHFALRPLDPAHRP
ncbi:hypothetical protein ABZ281_25860 [Streptomyces sp. NPDC006265]|uniref:hypothetical protein n=1 Tax=Streptomyces sp. NPDC006265 TaxID=3156740 RepID=UPI0033BC7595